MGGGAVPTCAFVSESGFFRVTNVKGKSFSTYGFMIPDDDKRQKQPIDGRRSADDNGDKSQHSENMSNGDAGECNSTDQGVVHQSATLPAISTSPTSWGNTTPTNPQQTQPQPPKIHLFIEEVLFLHERGLLEVYDEDEITVLDSPQLFGMLSKLGVAFPVYLTYSHLREQTYIVMRHTVQRLDIVDALLANEENRKRSRDNDCAAASKSDEKCGEQEQEQDQEEKETIHVLNRNDKGVGVRRLKRRLRMAEAYAPAPTLLRSTDTTETWDSYLTTWGDEVCSCSKCPIAFDVYNPNSSFRRTSPGRPAFCVAISPYAEVSPGFTAIHALVTIARGVPVRVATVADGGTVVMFSLTDYGVPPLDAQK